ncbi:MAG: hypothetical protein ACRD9S_01385 [Pyrinomonadaceae bacterium]
MELSGEEKRIRASFRELRLGDERVTPRFAEVWNRAKLRSARRQIALDFRLAVALVIVCFALLSLALLSRHWERNPQSSYAVVSTVVKPAASPVQIKKDQEIVKQVTREPDVRKPGLVKFTPRSQTAKLAARRSTARDAIALSQWQSPTTSLLRSPGDEVLRALPQLNQTLHNLKSFLPNRIN